MSHITGIAPNKRYRCEMEMRARANVILRVMDLMVINKDEESAKKVRLALHKDKMRTISYYTWIIAVHAKEPFSKKKKKSGMSKMHKRLSL